MVSSDYDYIKRFTHWDASSMRATGAWAARRRLAAAMREVIEHLVEIDAPEDDLSAAAEGLEKYSARESAANTTVTQFGSSGEPGPSRGPSSSNGTESVQHMLLPISAG